MTLHASDLILLVALMQGPPPRPDSFSAEPWHAKAGRVHGRGGFPAAVAEGVGCDSCPLRPSLACGCRHSFQQLNFPACAALPQSPLTYTHCWCRMRWCSAPLATTLSSLSAAPGESWMQRKSGGSASGTWPGPNKTMAWVSRGQCSGWRIYPCAEAASSSHFLCCGSREERCKTCQSPRHFLSC